MTDFLVFRLYGPLASWGDIAVGETRPSYAHPSKSAVIGLLAAALGIKRDEDAKQRELVEGFGFAVRVDSMGVPLSDYHTAQVPPTRAGRHQLRYAKRRDELSWLARDNLSTILSRRDYRAEALATVVLWTRQSAPYPFERLAQALKEPRYTLYLGRKSCPLALPVEPQIIAAGSIKGALAKAAFANLPELFMLPRGVAALYWEDGATSGLPAQHSFQRRDVPSSRRRWQFDVRLEHHASYGEEG